MKDFFIWLPSKWKGYYLIWFSFQFILIVIGGSSSDFYPIYWYWEWDTANHIMYIDFTDPFAYGFTEFLIYVFIPILITLIIYYLKPHKLIK